MRGFLFRTGVAIKDFGERAGHKKRCYARYLICVGLAIRDFAKGL